MTLFDRRLKLLGTVTDEDDPLSCFIVNEVRKDNWIFKMDQVFVLENTHFYKLATAHFNNGYLNCYILEGEPHVRSGFQATLKVDGAVKPVTAIGIDGMVFTSDGQTFKLNFRNDTIKESKRF